MLHAQIDGKLDRLLQAVGGEPGEMQRLQPVAVDPLLDAGDALVVDVDVADQVRHLGAVRIDALVLGQEANARQAEPVNLAALLWRDLALQPDESLAGADAVAHLGRIDIRQHCGQQLHRFIDVDDLARLREQRRRAHVGRENHAVAVDDVGPRRCDRIPGCAAPHEMTFRRHGEHHEPCTDDRIDGGESQNREADAGTRLGGAIDIAAIEQRAEQAPRLDFGRRRGRRRRLRVHRRHRCPIKAGMLPVTGFKSSILSAIASVAGGCTIVGGRSGNLSSESYCAESGGRRRRCRRASP